MFFPLSKIALEYLQEFIYYTYTFCTSLFERNVFLDHCAGWLKALGNLTEYWTRLACCLSVTSDTCCCHCTASTSWRPKQVFYARTFHLTFSSCYFNCHPHPHLRFKVFQMAGLGFNMPKPLALQLWVWHYCIVSCTKGCDVLSSVSNSNIPIIRGNALCTTCHETASPSTHFLHFIYSVIHIILWTF